MGLGAKLVGETLPLAGTECVELIAVMAKYNPFAERAGMRRVMASTADKQVAALAEALKGLGLELRFFGSAGYVADKFGEMGEKELGLVRSSFIKYKHPRFLKEFFSDVPFGRAADYEKCVKKASVEQLARLVRVCGFLLQEKVYLYWRKEN